MSIVLLLARVVLALVLGLAGIGKLSDLGASGAALTEFGLPEWLANPIGIALPFLELVIASLLLPLTSAWWGACAAFGLLLVFVLAIAFNMALGRRPECHCFGQLHSEPIGWSTLARNASLLVLAGLVLTEARHNPGLSLSAALVAVGHQAQNYLSGLFLLAVALQVWLTLHLFRQNGRLLLRIEGLEARLGVGRSSAAANSASLKVGTPAPDFELPVAGGGTQSLADLLARGKALVLIFTDPRCRPCMALLPDVAKWTREHSEKLTMIVISSGDPEVNARHSKKYGLALLIQKDREVAQDYKVFGTPGAVLVRRDGMVGSGVASGAQQIAGFIARETGAALPAIQRAEALAIGDPAPPVSLPDLQGGETRLEDFKGRDMLLLFWNPSCGFCDRMLPRLKEWVQNRMNGSPQLLVLSTGTVEQNKGISIGWPVLLEQDRNAMRLFGAAGTPSGLLIDAEGKVASSLAMGADAIFRLVGYETTTNPSLATGKSLAVQEAEGD